MIKLHSNIKIAKNRGYFVDFSGILYGPNGKKLIKKYGAQRYPTFTITIDNIVQSIPIHTLAAYCFYGEYVFLENKVIRHLNGNTLDVSFTNIKLGTHSENNLDKKKEVRSLAAKKARKSQGYRAHNHKFTDDEVKLIRYMFKNNHKQTKIAKKFNVTTQCIYLIVKKKAYKDVTD